MLSMQPPAQRLLILTASPTAVAPSNLATIFARHRR